MVVAFLDKTYPPAHSFIDGMLADAFPRVTGERVFLVVSRNPAFPRVLRYGRSICLNILPRRRGIGRLLGAVVVFRLAKRLTSRPRALGGPRLLVRNEPGYLAGAIAARSRSGRVAFQSSFPHEIGPWYSPKHSIGRFLLHLLLPLCDSALALTPSGAARLQRYSRSVRCHIVPLAGQLRGSACTPVASAARRPLRLVYIGSHSSLRQLHVVFAGAWRAHRDGAALSILSIGGSASEIAELRRSAVVRELEEGSVLQFLPSLSREEVLACLPQFDVGLCLIPPSPHYREASPTKLTEYMSAGLGVIVSAGIPAQVDVARASGAGLVVEFAEDTICAGLRALADGDHDVGQMRRSARQYIEAEYSYDRFVDVMERALA